MTAEFAEGMLAAERIVVGEADRIWKERDAYPDNPAKRILVGEQSQAVLIAASLIRKDLKAKLDLIHP